MARRFIIMALTAASSTEFLGLAAVTLALGATCRLPQERDDRPEVPSAGPGTISA